MGDLSQMMCNLKKPFVFNLIYQSLLLFTIGQQIYYPQSYKYMHLVVLLVRILISETYQNEYRVFKWDQFFIPMVFMSAIISIIEKVSGVHLGLLYLMILLGLIGMLAMFVLHVIKDSKDHLKEKMHSKHVDAYEKNKHFTLGLFYSLYAIAIVAFVYTFYELIQLIVGN
ncbi:hypothetical protein [Fusibacter sp. 3D3]|uniref:hypothetical protein n=1 Tax=Fusibacter sp. 3D3 TaxID=1048380 RepID=UPI000853367C|nr:hypothetical protein [Fusibacter sp. 3D3]GAU76998.1 hypothetical protein F3D3_1597 [Fusibacter sp. 3D3]